VRTEPRGNVSARAAKAAELIVILTMPAIWVRPGGRKKPHALGGLRGAKLAGLER
jgi:hypothetical protein